VSQELQRKKDVLKNKIYPLILEKGDSIEETKMYMQAAAMGIKQAFNGKMLEMKVQDLKMVSLLDNKADKYTDYVKIFDLLAEETITSALMMLEHVPAEIDNLVRTDNTKRKLADLNPQWL